MKKRTGFVSNSSSSSFVCCLCYNCDGGMDVSLSDVGFVQDELHYTYCEDHLDIDSVLSYCKEHQEELEILEFINKSDLRGIFTIFDGREIHNKNGEEYSEEDKDLYSMQLFRAKNRKQLDSTKEGADLDKKIQKRTAVNQLRKKLLQEK